MKRIYLLMLLFVAVATNAFAHRKIDFQVTLAKPTTSTVVNPGNSAFDIDVVIKNVGPDAFKASDTIYWYATIQGSPISWSFNGQTGIVWLRWGKALNPNDTMHMTFNGIAFGGYTGAADSTRTLCFNVFPVGPDADTIADNTTGNNSPCVSFLFKKTNGTGISTVSASGSSVTLYPNPATSVANVEVEMKKAADVTIKVLDMTGRVVTEVKKGMQSVGTVNIPVDVNNLANGLYIYEAILGDETITGKFNVQK